MLLERKNLKGVPVNSRGENRKKVGRRFKRKKIDSFQLTSPISKQGLYWVTTVLCHNSMHTRLANQQKSNRARRSSFGDFESRKKNHMNFSQKLHFFGQTYTYHKYIWALSATQVCMIHYVDTQFGAREQSQTLLVCRDTIFETIWEFM